MTAYPNSDLNIDEELVQSLIDSQFPEFSELSLKLVGSGWDNQNYKLGDQYLVRIPRRALGAELITYEIEWTQKLKGQLPLPIPAPIRVGKPDSSYPWHWSILPWFEGTAARNTFLAEPELFRLVHFLKKLHDISPEGAPLNPFRDAPLTSKADVIDERIQKNKLVLSPHVLKLWEEALAQEINTNPTLIHGDLHPGNIIVKEGIIQAVIDWGDITKGDPATDLAILWMLPMTKTLREDLVEEYGATPSTITRAKGWAVFFAVVFRTSGTEYEELGANIFSFLKSS
ncbi:MAG: aminoglycoside phosphotransferase family protein [Balneola sp.]|nr:MAG: aminoglycoside phosphotransferase family protein [Balneola sp.]